MKGTRKTSAGSSCFLKWKKVGTTKATRYLSGPFEIVRSIERGMWRLYVNKGDPLGHAWFTYLATDTLAESKAIACQHAQYALLFGPRPVSIDDAPTRHT